MKFIKRYVRKLIFEVLEDDEGIHEYIDKKIRVRMESFEHPSKDEVMYMVSRELNDNYEYNEIRELIGDTDQEKFIDRVVERINKKQIMGR